MRFKLAILISIYSTSVFSQENKLSELREYWTNGNIKSITFTDGTNKQGIWQYYDSLGMMTDEDKYVNGNKYYWNKWQNEKQIIKNGNGQLKEYYNNGLLKAMGKVKEGKKYGKWIEYYANGKRQNQIEYADWSGNYRSELRYNMLLVASYDTSGNLIGMHGNGIVNLTDYNGKIIRKEFYTNNHRDSCYLFYDNGNIQYIKHTDGIFNTEFTKKSFFFDGTREYEEISVGDTIIQSKWHSNGQIKEIKRIIENKEQITEFDKNGQATKVFDCSVRLLINDMLEEISKYDCIEKDLSNKRQE